MNITQDLTIQPTDGPVTCIYKAMYGRGWITKKEILALLADCHFSSSAITTHLGNLPKGMVESRAKVMTVVQRGPAPQELRLVESFPMPVTTTSKRTKRQRMASDESLIAVRQRLRQDNRSESIVNRFNRFY